MAKMGPQKGPPKTSPGTRPGSRHGHPFGGAENPKQFQLFLFDFLYTFLFKTLHFHARELQGYFWGVRAEALVISREQKC